MSIRKVYVVRVARRRSRKNAVGGFFESMLAMVIITAAVLILATTMSLISIGDDESSNRYEECKRAAARFLGNLSLMDGNSIDYDSLVRVEVSKLVPGDQLGTSVIVVELEDGRSVSLFSNSTSAAPAEASSITIPVTIMHSMNDIRPGLLTVSVWEK